MDKQRYKNFNTRDLTATEFVDDGGKLRSRRVLAPHMRSAKLNGLTPPLSASKGADTFRSQVAGSEATKQMNSRWGVAVPGTAPAAVLQASDASWRDAATPSSARSRQQPGKQPAPAAGQPGGAGDPLKQGLSGAGRKWYLRYLERGLEPEEARRRALEHRAPKVAPVERAGSQAFAETNVSPVERVSDEAAAGRKRQLHHTSPPDLPNSKKTKRKNSAALEGSRTSQVAKRPKVASYASVAKGTNLAILARDYPKRLLTKEELSAVEQALVEEMRKGWTAALNFNGIQFRDGMVLVDCMDSDAMKWLKLTVPSISTKVGVQLRTCLQENLLETNIVTVYLPRTAGETTEKSLGLLNEQNKGLFTETWRVIRHLESNGGKVLMLALDDEALKLLRKRDMLVSYRFGQLKCRLHKKKKPVEAADDVPGSSAATAKDEAAEAEYSDTVEAELVSGSLQGMDLTSLYMGSKEEPSNYEQPFTGMQSDAYLTLSESEEEF